MQRSWRLIMPISLKYAHPVPPVKTMAVPALVLLFAFGCAPKPPTPLSKADIAAMDAGFAKMIRSVLIPPQTMPSGQPASDVVDQLRADPSDAATLLPGQLLALQGADARIVAVSHIGVYLITPDGVAFPLLPHWKLQKMQLFWEGLVEAGEASVGEDGRTHINHATNHLMSQLIIAGFIEGSAFSALPKRLAEEIQSADTAPRRASLVRLAQTLLAKEIHFRCHGMFPPESATSFQLDADGRLLLTRAISAPGPTTRE